MVLCLLFDLSAAPSGYGSALLATNISSVSSENLEFHDAPHLIWIKVRDAYELLWDENPKLHDIGSLVQSLQRYGIQEIPKYDVNLKNISGGVGAIKAGNGRIETLYQMEKDGNYELPRGLARIPDTKDWVMPLLVGVDAESESLAKAYAIDSNNLTMSGGDFTGYDMSKLWDINLYLSVAESISDTLPVSLDRDILESLKLALSQFEEKQPKAIPISEVLELIKLLI